MDVMVIGGVWDLKGGRPSKLVEQFTEGVRKVEPRADLLNGGDWSDLPIWHPNSHTGVWGNGFSAPHVLFWMPDIPDGNAHKVIGEIKQRYPRMMLIGSKRIDGRDLTFPDVIDRMLKTKQNLGVIIDKVNGRYRMKLVDPLGNLFYHGDDFRELGRVAMERVQYLANVRRIRSQNGGILDQEAEVPKPFLDLIREYAEEFDRLVPRPKEVSRFLGNAAFRCSHGFPAFRSKGGVIYVSKRNVDKSGIGPDGFVACKPFEPFDSQVEFYHRDHEVKPSVDAPIDLLIFYHCPRINFLIHGHVYADTGHFTRKPIPCGAIEEFDAIRGKIGHDVGVFILNLKGHGFIAGASSIDKLRGLQFKARPMEELA